ncbi:MAG: hypothetical protein JWO13_1679 [Acidobacteriales bacterium]|nr:hypothetical protein [Terriglobales bacterium]
MENNDASRSWAAIRSALLVCTITLVLCNSAAALKPIQVWANSRSKVYHCPGSKSYENTKQGFLTDEDSAKSNGFRPAGGVSCSGVGSTSSQVSAAAKVRSTAVLQCGYERWPVKILMDDDATKVNLQPINATISGLLALRSPHKTLPYKRRFAPTELQTFVLTGRVQKIKLESDSDLHLILSEPSDNTATLVAELPAPQCAIGSPQEENFRKVQTQLLRLKIGEIVKVTGVGFFDRLHGQKGAARNGIELHPILELQQP